MQKLSCKGILRLQRGGRMTNKPHWIAENKRPKSFMWICSECKSTVYDMPMCSKKHYKKMCMYKYCPYCGVKMVGECEI